MQNLPLTQLTLSRVSEMPAFGELTRLPMAAGVSDHVWKIEEIVALLGG